MKHPFRLETAGVHVAHAKTSALAKCTAESLSSDLISDVDVSEWIANRGWRWIARFREGVLIEGSI